MKRDRMRTIRLLPSFAVLLLATACANDSSTSSSTDKPAQSATTSSAPAPAPAPYDPQPYCEITQQLEKAGERAFSGLDRNATSMDYEAAERAFVLDNADLLDELVAMAPPELTDEITTFLTAMRQRAGLEGSGVTARAATEAEEKLLEFEKQHC